MQRQLVAAGSERVGKSEATGDRLEEAKHINKSLSALGKDTAHVSLLHLSSDAAALCMLQPFLPYGIVLRHVYQLTSDAVHNSLHLLPGNRLLPGFAFHSI